MTKEDAITNIGTQDILTNGDKIMYMFPNYRVQILTETVNVYYEGNEEYSGSHITFDLNWWNSPCGIKRKK